MDSPKIRIVLLREVHLSPLMVDLLPKAKRLLFTGLLNDVGYL